MKTQIIVVRKFFKTSASFSRAVEKVRTKADGSIGVEHLIVLNPRDEDKQIYGTRLVVNS